MATYTMVFTFKEDKQDFIARAPFMKGGVKVVADLDPRTINVRFRKGTKCERIFGLAEIFNADIVGLTTK